ncbi:hypothetical protein [Thermorudis peleae]|uniref:hypothetical protein n=1 Tax=Thermorudis peleae TaxID=1382356 RepID=UPI0012E03674|nr:hypothetical protein [Thermorudis peleae]
MECLRRVRRGLTIAGSADGLTNAFRLFVFHALAIPPLWGRRSILTGGAGLSH